MKRSYAGLMQSYLKSFPCVALIGVRQCGKTTLLQTLPSVWRHFDLERRADHEVIGGLDWPAVYVAVKFGHERAAEVRGRKSG